MGFVSLAAIVIGGIIVGAILMSLLRGAMYFIVAVLAVGIAYYLFMASPQQKATMDEYANKVAESIYHVDSSKINEMINEAKVKLEAAKTAAQQKIQEFQKK